MAHPGIILVWYFANEQVFLCHCMLLPCILHVISFWRLSHAGDLSKSLGKFRLKCKGTECLCVWQRSFQGCVCKPLCKHRAMIMQWSCLTTGDLWFNCWNSCFSWTKSSSCNTCLTGNWAGRKARQTLGAYSSLNSKAASAEAWNRTKSQGQNYSAGFIQSLLYLSPEMCDICWPHALPVPGSIPGVHCFPCPNFPGEEHSSWEGPVLHSPLMHCWKAGVYGMSWIRHLLCNPDVGARFSLLTAENLCTPSFFSEPGKCDPMTPLSCARLLSREEM